MTDDDFPDLTPAQIIANIMAGKKALEDLGEPQSLDFAFGIILRRRPQGPYLCGVTSEGKAVWTQDKSMALRMTLAGADNHGRDLWGNDHIEVAAHLFHRAQIPLTGIR